MAIPTGGYLEAQISLSEMLVRPSSNEPAEPPSSIVQVGPEAHALGFRLVAYGASGCQPELPARRRALAELGDIALALGLSLLTGRPQPDARTFSSYFGLA